MYYQQFFIGKIVIHIPTNKVAIITKFINDENNRIGIYFKKDVNSCKHYWIWD